MLRATTMALAMLLAASTLSAQPLEGRLKRIASTKTITLAYRADATPFSYVNEKKEIVGFSIDLCRRVAQSIEAQLKLKDLRVQLVPVTVQTRFDAVSSGKADMECGSSTVTLSRMKQVDFSSFIFVESTGLLAKAAAGLGSLQNLAGKKISVVAGTTNERALRAQLSAQKVNATVVPFKSRDEAFGALVGDKVDAFASDKLLLIGAVSTSKDQKFYLLPDQLSFEPYAIVLPRNDSSFRLAVNTALSRIFGSGEIMKLHNHWFAQFGDPGEVAKLTYLLGTIPD